jgi:hypothetical protein
MISTRYVGFLAVVALALGMGGEARGEQVDGYLKAQNYVGGYSSIANILDYDYPGISDAYNIGYDSLFISPQSGRPGIYSNISAYEADTLKQKVKSDYRLPTTLHDTFDIELMFNGSISSVTTNYLFFSFPTTDIFGSEPISLQKTDASGNPLGSSYDVRAIIAGTLGGSLNPSAGRFNLPDLAAGSYNVNTPYAHYAITIDNSVPEPSSLTLLIVGALALGWWGRRRLA